MPSSAYVPASGQPTGICPDCKGAAFAINTDDSCAAGAMGSPVLLVSGQISFDLPLLSVPAIGSSGFSFGLSYLSGYAGTTSSDGTVGSFNYPQNIVLAPNGFLPSKY